MIHLDPASVLATGGGSMPALFEARGAQRQQTTFVIGRIAASMGDLACLVRNMSATGVGIEHQRALKVDMVVAIETRTMLLTRAIVRWADATAAGLEFLEQPRIVTRSGVSPIGDRHVLRSPRFALDCDANLEIDGLSLPTRTSDLSLGGLKLAGIVVSGRSSQARVCLPQIDRTFAGQIRWHSATSAGFQFVAPLSSRELSAILAAPERAVR